MSTAKVLRDRITEGMVTAPFVVDGMQALMAEKAEFGACYVTGFGVASTYGLPDVGLITMNQMCEKIRAISYCSELPIIADADTGYGNYINVMQTVREYERAGAAALHIEDQVWPKRCGYMLNKQVIPTDEAVTKIRAAVDARKDEDFLIIARTDTLAVNGWDDVEDRVHKFMEAGADIAFVDGIRTMDDVKEYASRLSDVPLIFNNVPIIPAAALSEYKNIKVMLTPLAMATAWSAYAQALGQIKAGATPKSDKMDQGAFDAFIDLLKAREYFALDKKYGAGIEKTE